MSVCRLQVWHPLGFSRVWGGNTVAVERWCTRIHTSTDAHNTPLPSHLTVSVWGDCQASSCATRDNAEKTLIPTQWRLTTDLKNPAKQTWTHTLVIPNHNLLWLFPYGLPWWIPVYIILWFWQLSALSSPWKSHAAHVNLLLCGLDSSQINTVWSSPWSLSCLCYGLSSSTEISAEWTQFCTMRRVCVRTPNT